MLGPTTAKKDEAEEDSRRSTPGSSRTDRRKMIFKFTTTKPKADRFHNKIYYRKFANQN
jgi:hypothetical protein